MSFDLYFIACVRRNVGNECGMKYYPVGAAELTCVGIFLKDISDHSVVALVRDFKSPH